MNKVPPGQVVSRPADADQQAEYKFLPKNIFQTWESARVNEPTRQAVNTWLHLNPDWQYCFFDKDKRRAFIENNFSSHVLAAYDSLIPGAYKADLWRYCILYVKGGVYADIKISLCKPLNILLDQATEFTSVNERQGAHHLKGAIWNTFMASRPGHPFLKHAIDMIVENVRQRDYGKNALYPTGPFLLGRAINTTLGRGDNAGFNSGRHEINGYTFTLWHTPRHKKNRAKINYVYTDKTRSTVCFAPSYVGYRQEKKQYMTDIDAAYDYAYCWRNCRAYDKEIDERKVLYPTLKQIRFQYQHANIHKARALIFKTLWVRRQFHWRIVRYYIRYDLLAFLFKPAK